MRQDGDHRAAGCSYPLEMEYQFRKHLLAGDKELTLATADKFFDLLEGFSRGNLDLLKAWLLQGIVILAHKAWQIGAPVVTVNTKLVDFAVQMEKLDSRDSLRQFFLGIVDLLLSSINDQNTTERLSVKVQRYVQAHFHKELSLTEVARAVHLDPVFVSNLLMLEEGCTFRDYLARIRVNEAKKILLDKGFSVAEVASQVGYRDSAYFIRVFKRINGITPGQFARQNKDNTPVPIMKVPALSVKLGEDGIFGGDWALKEKELWLSLLSGDEDRTFAMTLVLLEEFARLREQLPIVRSYVLKLVVVLCRKCIRAKIPSQDILNDIVAMCCRMAVMNGQELFQLLKSTIKELLARVEQHCGDLSLRAVEVVKSYIHNNYANPVKLSDLAALVHFSPFHLSRVFTRAAGCTPYEYLTNIRIGAAKELLYTSRFSVEEIAFAVGYQDCSHFITFFKKKVGQTPRKFMELRLGETELANGMIGAD